MKAVTILKYSGNGRNHCINDLVRKRCFKTNHSNRMSDDGNCWIEDHLHEESKDQRVRSRDGFWICNLLREFEVLSGGTEEI